MNFKFFDIFKIHSSYFIYDVPTLYLRTEKVILHTIYPQGNDLMMFNNF